MGEQESFLDLIIKAYIHSSTALTGAAYFGLIESLLQVRRIFLPVRLKRLKPSRQEDPAYLKQNFDQNEGPGGSLPRILAWLS